MKSILVVDDEPEILTLLSNRLKEYNYDVICANTAKEGILFAQQQTPDIILMDIMMPEVNGGDAVKILKNLDDTKKIPIIFLTGAYDKREAEHEMGINVEGTFYPSVAKPFNISKLLLEIRNLIG